MTYQTALYAHQAHGFGLGHLLASAAVFALVRRLVYALPVPWVVAPLAVVVVVWLVGKVRRRA